VTSVCARLVACAVIRGANRGIKPDVPLARRGVLDEAAHVATTFLALSAVRPRQRQFAAGALAAAVLIDVDHVPDAIFGWTGITKGSPRPFSHSLVTLACALIAVRFASAPRRELMGGVAFGLATHFLRDITDGSAGAPLLWPFTTRAVKLPTLQCPIIVAALCWTVLDACREAHP
jgi:inner membrane protein